MKRLPGDTELREAAAAIPGRLRPARAEDARLLWEWANDPEVRRQAFRSEAISWESHAAWYAAKLADPGCLIAILETGNGPVGQIRFDQGPEGLEVDVSITASRRGQGLGRALLTQGLTAAAQRWPQGTTVIAKALIDNRRSIQLFEQCGFVSRGVRAYAGKSFCQLERPL